MGCLLSPVRSTVYHIYHGPSCAAHRLVVLCNVANIPQHVTHSSVRNLFRRTPCVPPPHVTYSAANHLFCHIPPNITPHVSYSTALDLFLRPTAVAPRRCPAAERERAADTLRVHGARTLGQPPPPVVAFARGQQRRRNHASGVGGGRSSSGWRGIGERGYGSGGGRGTTLRGRFLVRSESGKVCFIGGGGTRGERGGGRGERGVEAPAYLSQVYEIAGVFFAVRRSQQAARKQRGPRKPCKEKRIKVQTGVFSSLEPRGGVVRPG